MALQSGMTSVVVEPSSARKRVVRILARPGDPYVDDKGQTFLPYGSVARTEDEIAKVDAKKYKPNKKRTIKDLPARPDILKGVSCVLVFTLLGLGDREIADGLGIAVDDVRSIRKMPAYSETFEAVAGEFIDSNSEFIHSRLAGYSNEAVTQVANIMKAGKEVNRLKAADSILDRAGFTAKTGRDRGNDGGNELRIVVTDGDKHVEVSINQ